MEEKSFEQSMKRLEEIIGLMNQPSTPFDVSLKLYEEANTIIQSHQSRLQKAKEFLKRLEHDDGVASNNEMHAN